MDRLAGISADDIHIGVYRYSGLRMNLGFFKDDGTGEKTEAATPRKKEKAREEGQVAKSQEVNTAFLLIAAFVALRVFGLYIFNSISGLFHYAFSYISNPTDILNENTFNRYMFTLLTRVLIIVMPMLMVALGVGLVINIVQVGWHPTTKPLTPKLSKLNPINGFKKIFSTRALMDLLKSLLKLAVISIVIYNTVRGEIQTLAMYIGLEMITSLAMIADLAIRVGINVGVLFLFIALIDFIYQRYKHAKDLRMSKYEVKQEYKDIEGNPLIKGKIKQKMREVSMRRMMQDVPGADVIITNPTHFAVALKYDAMKGTAPTVVAKGADFLAMKIKEVAAAHNVVIVENKPLARALYATVDIGKEIPPELYATVAEVLAYVYKMKNVVA